jgi:hypothetical protein
MNRALAALLLAAGAVLPTGAAACGACDEDKIAATYDHAVIERARREHGAVVFAAITGNGSAARLEKVAAQVARHTRGVDKSSVRSSPSPLALSFAVDANTDPARALADVQRVAGAAGVHLAVVKVQR